jgi:hypothetical protein
MTEQEAIEKARADYASVVGTIIEVPSLCGYSGEDSCEWYYDEPIRVLVLPTADGDVTRTCDNFVDPYWNVEVIELALKPEAQRFAWNGEPRPLPADASSFWVDGLSYEFEKKKRASGVGNP